MHPVTFRSPFERTSEAPRIVAVIPARYQSSRLPGKPLVDIAGRPMIEHVYRRAAAVVGAVVVATDDARIVEAVERFGGIARMTSAGHRTGTDRIAEVARDLTCDIVINVQGDLPLIEPSMIAEMIAPLVGDATCTMSTLCSAADPAEYDNPNVVKVVVDRHGDALYFSRSPIPFFRDSSGPPEGGPYIRPGAGSGPPGGGPHTRSRADVGAAFRRPTVFKHIGLYGYRRDFLMTFAALPQTPLEQAESLEQLRALEHGFRIRAVETRNTTIEVDTPDDLERVRRQLTTAAHV